MTTGRLLRVFLFRPWRRIAAAGVIMLVLTALPASGVRAQSADYQALMFRLERLERDVQDLNRQLGAGGGLRTGRETAESPAFARLEVRVSALEEDVRNATGQVERLGFELKKLSDRLETALSDLEQRSGRADGITPAPAPPSPPATAARPPATAPATPAIPPPAAAVRPQPATPATPPAAATGTAQEQYSAAFELLQRAQYPQAEKALKAFIDGHPNDALTENARYWLGETYYARGNFAEAAQAFLATYQTNKQGSKAADALLKLGMSMARLDKSSEACTTFRELDRSFPDLSPRIRKKVGEEKKRINCS